MSENRDGASYSELRTDDLAQVEAFLRQCADKLESHQITLRKVRGLFVADCSSTEEPSI